MPDLERWLADVEGRHRTQGEYLDFVNGGIHQQRCYGCMQDWPCDTITMARVIRAQAKALDDIKSQSQPGDSGVIGLAEGRIAAIIEGGDGE